MITRIQVSELAQLARRVYFAGYGKASGMNKGSEDAFKKASFEAMGYDSQSTEFPMRSGEWVVVGQYEIRVSYPKWDIPGYIDVRRHIGYRDGDNYRELEG